MNEEKRDLREISHKLRDEGLQPRDACKCGSAMQAAIAEKVEKLGLWSGNYYSGHDGFWVVDSGPNKGKVHPACFSSNPTRPLNFLTPAQFLTRLEHTSPPVKERTTEQKLKEAVRFLEKYYSIKS